MSYINNIKYEIICFNNLDKESVSKITSSYLSNYHNKFDFEVNEESFVEEVMKKEDVNKYGARYIKRELKKNLLKLLENKAEVR